MKSYSSNVISELLCPYGLENCCEPLHMGIPKAYKDQKQSLLEIKRRAFASAILHIAFN
ncbi:11807_t:CDS:1, partial [Gigaspora rosea]